MPVPRPLRFYRPRKTEREKDKKCLHPNVLNFFLNQYTSPSHSCAMYPYYAWIRIVVHSRFLKPFLPQNISLGIEKMVVFERFFHFPEAKNAILMLKTIGCEQSPEFIPCCETNANCTSTGSPRSKINSKSWELPPFLHLTQNAPAGNFWTNSCTYM